jgi:hypothetical protein
MNVIHEHHPKLTEIHFTSDNGAHFSGNLFATTLPKLSTEHIKILSLLKTEPDSKCAVNVHFLFMTKTIEHYKQTHDIQSLEDIYNVFLSNSIKNTLCILIDIKQITGEAQATTTTIEGSLQTIFIDN